MCSPYDAQPPDLADGVERPRGERLVLTASDGAEFAAYAVAAVEPTGAGVVIMPDVRGLFSFYETLAENFAACGVTALTIDYFGRTAGTEVPRGEDFDFMSHVQQTRPDLIRLDVAAGVARLRGTTQVQRLYTVGFCFGGAQSFMQAAADHELAGVVGFYGRPRSRDEGGTGPLDVVTSMKAPVLGLFGGADQGIPVTDVQAFDHSLSAAGVAHEITVYDGAPHSFFDRKSADHREACEDAWRRMLAFMGAATTVPVREGGG